MRISDWSSDVCSSDLPERVHALLVDIDHTPRHVLHHSHAPFYTAEGLSRVVERLHPGGVFALWSDDPPDDDFMAVLDELFHTARSEEHTSELPSLMRISYAVFCLKKKNNKKRTQ